MTKSFLEDPTGYVGEPVVVDYLDCRGFPKSVTGNLRVVDEKGNFITVIDKYGGNPLDIQVYPIDGFPKKIERITALPGGKIAERKTIFI